MELIPVFSLIVLVATIGTFILAVGAYIMFRVRESRRTPEQKRTATSYEADVFAPQPVEPAIADMPANLVRREIPREARVRQFQSAPVGPAVDPNPGDRSAMQ